LRPILGHFYSCGRLVPCVIAGSCENICEKILSLTNSAFQQEGSLCAQHCLNSLLQGQFYSAVDLGELAAELDTMERRRMAEMGEESAEYRAFIQQPSANMDDSGFFSVQVISRALSVWGLELVPRDSSDPVAVRAKSSPIAANAYICNYREHWFAIRRLGNQWFNLNSLLEGPELVSNSYLGEFLAQLQQEGYSIFLVTGTLPECDADLVLQAVPAVQAVPPRLLSDVASSGTAGTSRRSQGRAPAPVPGVRGASSAQEDEAAELEAAMMMSLAETSGGGGAAAQLDSDTLDEVMAMQRSGNMNQEEELEMALRLSQQQHQQPAPVPEVSEEDEIQRAIALSLEGGQGALGAGFAAGSAGGAAETGWGERLARQEREEEQKYKEEAERAVREEEEQLRQALAMSMDMDTGTTAPKLTTTTTAKASSTPKSSTDQKTSASAAAAGSSPAAKPAEASRVDPVQAGWHKPKNPAPGSIASTAPAAAGLNPPLISPTSPKASQPTSPPSKAAATPAMPEGPGHTLGGGATSARRATGKAEDDPQEIRRRRLAFLDKMAKEQKEKEQGQ